MAVLTGNSIENSDSRKGEINSRLKNTAASLATAATEYYRQNSRANRDVGALGTASTSFSV